MRAPGVIDQLLVRFRLQHRDEALELRMSVLPRTDRRERRIRVCDELAQRVVRRNLDS